MASNHGSLDSKITSNCLLRSAAPYGCTTQTNSQPCPYSCQQLTLRDNKLSAADTVSQQAVSYDTVSQQAVTSWHCVTTSCQQLTLCHNKLSAADTASQHVTAYADRRFRCRHCVAYRHLTDPAEDMAVQLFSTPAVYRLTGQCSFSVHQLCTDLQWVTVNVLHNIETEFGLSLIVLRLIKIVSKWRLHYKLVHKCLLDRYIAFSDLSETGRGFVAMVFSVGVL